MSRIPDRLPGNLAQPLDSWLEGLVSADQVQVTRARGELGTALASADEAMRSRAAHLLLRALERGEQELGGQALALLQAYWYPPPAHMAEQAVTAVIAALAGAEQDSERADHAALLLANVCQQAPEQVDALTAALQHGAPGVRRAAAGALGRLGVHAAPSCSALVKRLKDADPEVAAAALDALCALAPLAPDTVARGLLKVVRSGDGPRRHRALIGLNGLLAEARANGLPRPDALEGAGAALVAASESEDAQTRLEAVACMGQLESRQRSVLDALGARLQDDDHEVTAMAATCLLTLRSNSKAALSRLEALLRADEEPQQRAVVAALASLDPDVLGRGPLRKLLHRIAAEASDPLGQELHALLGRALRPSELL